MFSPSYSVYLGLIFLCACLSSTAVLPTGPEHLNCTPSAPQRTSESVWEHLWLSLQETYWYPIGRGQEAAKMTADIKKSCTSLSYLTAGTIYCCSILLNPSTRHTVSTQTRDRGCTDTWKFLSGWTSKPLFSIWHSLKCSLFSFFLLPQRHCWVRQCMTLSVTNFRTAVLPGGRHTGQELSPTIWHGKVLNLMGPLRDLSQMTSQTFD